MEEKEVKAKTKEPTELSKFASKIFSSDIKTAKNSVLNGVIIPEIKTFLSRVSTSFLDSLLFGKGSGPSNQNYRNYSNISYNQYSNNIPIQVVKQDLMPVGIPDLKRTTFDNRGDAEVVLSKMYEALNRYGKVSVWDFFDFAGIKRSDPSSYNYGWKSLAGAEVRRSGLDEYYINFPQIIPIS